MMAANNYFGFAQSQYRSPSIVITPQPTATAYPAAAQTAYVQPAQPTAYAAAPQAAQTYSTYPAAATHTTGQYAYAHAAAAARPQPTAHTYDATKAYYAQAAAPAAAATTVYSVAESPYQTTAKPAYTTSYAAPAMQQRQTINVATKPMHTASPYTVYPTSAAPTTGTSSIAGTAYNPTTTTQSYTASGYDAALYSAATTYYQQQQAAKAGTTWQYKKNVVGSTFKPKPKIQPKQQQLHYCDVCKISCAGPQTYREHLEGQKHKKKDAAAKALQAGTTTSKTRAQNQLRCELCDVACTGTDAYAAHVRGAKHEKVMKLHTKLGKPIPSTSPVAVASSSKTTTGTPKNGSVTNTASRKVVSTPKITFVGAGSLKTGGVTEDSKSDTESIDEIIEKDVIPVGQEYIEEMKNESGKVVSFNCKLCDCKFNDPNAKEMHMKGRKHRLQYKKKVDPSLPVDVKPSLRQRKMQEDKLRRQAASKEDFIRRREMEGNWHAEMHHRMEQEASYMYNFRPGFGRGFGPGPGFGPPPDMIRTNTAEDRHVLAKHNLIYPIETELRAVQNIVSSCEKALKLVSDSIAESDAPVQVKVENKEVKKVTPVKLGTEDKKTENKDEQATRAIKGVMRVGVLAKGLLLHNDLNVQLVLLCNEKPTRTLLVRIADALPKQLLASVEDKEQKLTVRICVEEAAIIVTSQTDPKVVCKITLTSPIMREDAVKTEDAATPKKDPPDVLDKVKCLEALAALRHAKWFQARANALQSCVMIIRILRDLCQRVPTWKPLNEWAMELLVEKCVATARPNTGPGDAMRRVFESIASGMFLPGGPGLRDPCEKETHDCCLTMTAQEREDITASAQHALRLIAFRQIHKVLGMDALPAPRLNMRGGRPPFNPRKRRHANSTGDAEGTSTVKQVKKEPTKTITKK